MKRKLEEILGHPIKIGLFCNFYNEEDGIQNHINEKLYEKVDACIYHDGKYPGFRGKHAHSTDKSLELLHKIPNTYIITANEPISEMDKNNACFRKAAELGLDFLIQCDADEWFELDKNMLTESFDFETGVISTFQYMVRFSNLCSSPPRKVNFLPRLFFKPEFLECKNIHWWFYALGVRCVVDPDKFLDGVHMFHDDRVRKVFRNDKMTEYQQENIKRERAIMRAEAGVKTVTVGSHRHEYHPLYEGGMKCFICNIGRDEDERDSWA